MKRVIKWFFILVGVLVLMSIIWATKDLSAIKAVELDEFDLENLDDGNYYGKYENGRFSNELTVEIKDKKIRDIKVTKPVLSSNEALILEIKDKILSEQSLDVDAVSGATYTTKAYLKAIENALMIEREKTVNEEIGEIDKEEIDEINETDKEETVYEQISGYMWEESIEAFSPYYELLNHEITGYEEEKIGDHLEVLFFYKLIQKNYDRDPDTVGYIKEAKEQGNVNYQLMYDEYLAPREMNFQLKIVIDEKDVMTLYANNAPVGTQWEPVSLTDYILSN
ncbi:FMN-binding protein [Petrocella sp. FN5]|uniref:FMN-binding protein n=1 Tax=Petrocella sp. FN5 TaxID=3032002 RepID=UPI0023DA9090|nr:FMN-binding protein [Petrocella sp. FN5]MDF1617176.1 FMN-binding protein [Petrocella sp. FN5]